MPRPPLMKHPVRMHLSIERETLRRLRTEARAKHTTPTFLLRDLAESYTAGKVVVRRESIADAVAGLRSFRDRLPKPRKGPAAAKLIRDLRDRRG